MKLSDIRKYFTNSIQNTDEIKICFTMEMDCGRSPVVSPSKTPRRYCLTSIKLYEHTYGHTNSCFTFIFSMFCSIRWKSVHFALFDWLIGTAVLREWILSAVWIYYSPIFITFLLIIKIKSVFYYSYCCIVEIIFEFVKVNLISQIHENL